MDLPKLLPGESVVFNWPESNLLVTNKRVRTLYRNRRTGAQRLASVMLGDICCCTVEKTKLRWLLSASILWTAMGLYFRHEAAVFADRPAAAGYSSLMWGFFMAAVAFLGLYILVRRTTVKIHAPAGVLEWCVPLRPAFRGEDIVGIVEMTKDEAFNAKREQREEEQSHHCSGHCAIPSFADSLTDAPETEPLISLGVATIPADVLHPLKAAKTDQADSES